jgi:hypothetical protein
MQITIATVETRNSETKGDYAYGKGVINKKGGGERAVTIMSFGPQFESVRDILKDGATVDVKAVFNGGILKILGPVEAKQDEAAAA